MGCNRAAGLHLDAESQNLHESCCDCRPMPIYEFECNACGNIFDRLQKISDPDPMVCPDCGKKKIHRRVTAPSFRLSGSGWYETDFKKDGDRKRNLAGSEEAPKADAGKAAVEPKPADKPIAKPAAVAEPAAAKTD